MTTVDGATQQSFGNKNIASNSITVDVQYGFNWPELVSSECAVVAPCRWRIFAYFDAPV